MLLGSIHYTLSNQNLTYLKQKIKIKQLHSALDNTPEISNWSDLIWGILGIFKQRSSKSVQLLGKLTLSFLLTHTCVKETAKYPLDSYLWI